MTMVPNQAVPDFYIETSEGLINFHEWIDDQWVILFSYQADYSSSSTIELIEASHLQPEFVARGVKLIGLSVGPLDDSFGWTDDLREIQGHALNFPLIADRNRIVSSLLGHVYSVADPKLAESMVFVIDRHKRMRLSLTYPLSMVRNFEEILNLVAVLQTRDRTIVTSPMKLRPDQREIIPLRGSVREEHELFPLHRDAAPPYLRYERFRD